MRRFLSASFWVDAGKHGKEGTMLSRRRAIPANFDYQAFVRPFSVWRSAWRGDPGESSSIGRQPPGAPRPCKVKALRSPC